MAPMMHQSTRGFASLFILIQTMLNVCFNRVAVSVLWSKCPFAALQTGPHLGCVIITKSSSVSYSKEDPATINIEHVACGVFLIGLPLHLCRKVTLCAADMLTRCLSEAPSSSVRIRRCIATSGSQQSPLRSRRCAEETALFLHSQAHQLCRPAPAPPEMLQLHGISPCEPSWSCRATRRARTAALPPLDGHL